MPQLFTVAEVLENEALDGDVFVFILVAAHRPGEMRVWCFLTELVGGFGWANKIIPALHDVERHFEFVGVFQNKPVW